MTNHIKVLAAISNCDDSNMLKTWIKNAHDRAAPDVEDAAFRKLIAIVPSGEPGTLEHDFWQMVNALEFTLQDERGKTTRLSRTRQKAVRVGVERTLKDWALAAEETEGFTRLIERGMPELTGEAIVLSHPDTFDETVRAAAQTRLEAAGVIVAELPHI